MDNGTLGVIVSFLIGVITVLAGLGISKTTARNYDAKTIDTLSRQVNTLVNDRVKDRQEFEALQSKFGMLENEFAKYKDRIREYFDELMQYFDSKGLTDYPKLPIERSTKDKMKPVRGSK